MFKFDINAENMEIDKCVKMSALKPKENVLCQPTMILEPVTVWFINKHAIISHVRHITL
jgi:hypothetical protein